MATADRFSLETSNSDGDSPEFLFTERNLQSLNDSNQGSYVSGSVIFQTSVVTNSMENWCDMKNSYIVLPLTMEVAASAGLAFDADQLSELAWAASLKNSTLQLVHSLSVKMNGTQIVDPIQFNNMTANWEFLNEATPQDVQRWADLMMFGKDSSESVAYSTGAGECNNDITNEWTLAAGVRGTNIGRRERMRDSTAVSITDPGIGPLISNMTDGFDMTYLARCVSTTASLVRYYITAIIPLRVLHPIFREWPLARHQQLEFLINTPCPCSSTITYSNAGACTNVLTTTQNNASFPCMISQLATAGSTGLNVAEFATGGKIQISLAIARSASGSTSHPLNVCRMYLSMVRMSAETAVSYLRQPVREFFYRKPWAAPIIYSQARNSTVDQILTQSIANVRGILILPYISAASNGATSVSPIMSPFSSAPGTCSAFAHITELQVWMGGTPVFQSPLTRRFEAYLAGNMPYKNRFGGVQLGDCQGLLNYKDYNSAYCGVYVDLSRQEQSLDSTTKSIRVQFNNKSNFTMDYYIFIYTQASLSIDVEHGQLVAV